MSEDTWCPPVGKIIVREVWNGPEIRVASLSFAMALPKTTEFPWGERSTHVFRDLGHAWHGDSQPGFGTSVDSMRGAESITADGLIIRRRLATDEDLRAFMAGWRGRQPYPVEMWAAIAASRPGLDPAESERLCSLARIDPALRFECARCDADVGEPCKSTGPDAYALAEPHKERGR